MHTFCHRKLTCDVARFAITLEPCDLKLFPEYVRTQGLWEIICTNFQNLRIDINRVMNLFRRYTAVLV